MDFAQATKILQRLGWGGAPGPGRLKPPLPMTVLQVAPGRVSAIRLVPSERRPTLATFRETTLPPGAVEPSLLQPNIPDPVPVGRAIAETLAAVAPREIRLSVVIPDSVARVSILRFTRMPPTRRETLDLIRFRMQKVLPFRVEEAALDYHLLSEPGSAEPDFLVALLQRPILWQYERLFTERNLIPGLVDLDSFNVVNLARRCSNGNGMGAGDRALVNLAEGYLTVLFFRDGVMKFCRTKPLAADERSGSGPLRTAVRRELVSCAAYYREHLAGTGLAEATVRVADGDLESALRDVQEELGCPSRLLEPGRAVVLPPGSDPAELRWQRLAPALGAALGRRA